MLEIVVLIIEQFLIYVPLVIGAYFTIGLLKVPDLALESAFIVGALVGAKVASLCGFTLFGLIITLFTSLLSGAAVGLVVSLINRFGRIAYLLSSIITLGLFHGLLQYMPGAYVSLSSSDNLLSLMPVTSRHPEIIILLLLAFLVVTFFYMFTKSQLGFCAGLYGKNPRIFPYYGQSTSFIVATTVMLAHALAGFSGYLAAQTQGFADIHMGFGKILFVLTALILGKTMVNSQRPISFFMPLIGCAAYFVMQQLLLSLGLGLTYFTSLQALVILVVLLTQSKDREAVSSDHLGV